MLMPIVSMNKMAMNESVAATCCYRQVPSPTNVYWEVLNGGWLGNGFKNDRSLKHVSMKPWLALGFDLKPKWSPLSLNDVNSTNPLPGIAKFTIDDQTEWWMTDDLGNNAGILLDTWLANGPDGNLDWGRGPSCDHKSTGSNICAYYNQNAAYAYNQHFEAKSKHSTGGDDWAFPHDAKQFNS